MWLVGLGGMIGTLLRYYMGKAITARTGSVFPWGTWVVNISGSILLGAMWSLNSNEVIPDWLWLFVGTGFCGAYTTFSTFGYEFIQLIENRRFYSGIAYVVTSIIFGIVGAWLGITLFE